MAEPFGIAASAIQVAGAGWSLAKTLHAYVDTVKSAQKQLKAVATEVKLTASVLEHLGALLKENEAEKLCTANVITDARDALSGCRDAFKEIEEAFKGAAKAGLSAVSTSARLAWPFRKGKVEALQANLERLKSTLLLMLSVLSYAREKTARPAADALSLQRIQIQNLIKAKDDATVRYEELLADVAKLQTSDGARASATTDKAEPSPFVTLNAAPDTNTSCGLDQKQPHSYALLTQLGICASAVSHLAVSISAAMTYGGSNDLVRFSQIKEAFGAVNGAVNALMMHDKSSGGRSQPSSPMDTGDPLQIPGDPGRPHLAAAPDDKLLHETIIEHRYSRRPPRQSLRQPAMVPPCDSCTPHGSPSPYAPRAPYDHRAPYHAPHGHSAPHGPPRPSVVEKRTSLSEEEHFDAFGNKIESSRRQKKLTSAELRRKKKERMSRRQARAQFSDEDEDDDMQDLMRLEIRDNKRPQMTSKEPNTGECPAASGLEPPPPLTLPARSPEFTDKSAELPGQPAPAADQQDPHPPSPSPSSAEKFPELNSDFGNDVLDKFDFETFLSGQSPKRPTLAVNQLDEKRMPPSSLSSDIFAELDLDHLGGGYSAGIEFGKLADDDGLDLDLDDHVGADTDLPGIHPFDDVMGRGQDNEVDELIKRWTTVEV